MYRISKGKFLTGALISCFLLGSIIDFKPALAEEILGPWCLKLDPNNRIYNQIITIKATDFGTYEAHIEMLFGIPQNFDLIKDSEDNFEVSGGLNKEGYRLLPNGNLEFHNIYQPVGVGIKIPEGQDQQDCFN